MNQQKRKHAKRYGPEIYSKIGGDNNGFRDDIGADTVETVDLLTDLAAGGSVLELEIGAGRVACPLAARGLSGHGIDAGKEMVVRFQKKPSSNAAIPVTIGNFAGVMSPIFVGSVTDATGSYIPAFCILALMPLSLVVAGIFLPETGRRD